MSTACSDEEALIQRIEACFGIKGSLDEWGAVATLGDITCLVRSKVAPRRPFELCLTSHVFYGLRQEICRLVAIDRRRVRPAAPIETLVPSEQRRRVWRALRTRGYRLPNLTRSATTWAVGLVGSAMLALAIAVSTGVWCTGLLFWPVLYGLFAFLTAPMGRSCRFTVGELAMILVPQFVEEGYSMDNRTLETAVRFIVADELGVDVDELEPTTRFVEDLNVG